MGGFLVTSMISEERVSLRNANGVVMRIPLRRRSWAYVAATGHSGRRPSRDHGAYSRGYKPRDDGYATSRVWPCANLHEGPSVVCTQVDSSG